MKALKIWGWLLLASAAALYGYGWVSGVFNGHGIARMDPLALALTVLSVVCARLAVTVWVTAAALREMQTANKP